ncbi:unnamed protein product, partial [Rotaria sp. Silwood2]
MGSSGSTSNVIILP